MSVQLTRHRFALDDYARAGLREFWLVDLVHDQVQVHREPTPSGFGFIERRRRRAHVEPIAFPGLALRVDELLG
jgi:Uma2 family endonuclease